nr:MAG TPA: hypothetical protein [Caudoviricetes sp.]
MIGKSVRLMWTVQNLAFLRLVSHCAPFPAALARPTAARHNAGRLSRKADTRGRPLWAVRLRLGGMGAGGMWNQARRRVSPPNTENTKKAPFSFKKSRKKQKGDFQFYKSALLLLHKYIFNFLLTYRYVYGIFKAHRRCYQCKSIKQLGK